MCPFWPRHLGSTDPQIERSEACGSGDSIPRMRRSVALALMSSTVGQTLDLPEAAVKNSAQRARPLPRALATPESR